MCTVKPRQTGINFVDGLMVVVDAAVPRHGGFG
jgi:hypothetical protein